MKWTAFDQETAGALSAHFPAVELAPAGTDELDAALAAAADATASAVLLPSRDGENALFITMKTRDAVEEAKPQTPVMPASYQAGGFLGLVDEPIFEDEEDR